MDEKEREKGLWVEHRLNHNHQKQAPVWSPIDTFTHGAKIYSFRFSPPRTLICTQKLALKREDRIRRDGGNRLLLLYTRRGKPWLLKDAFADLFVPVCE